MGHEDSYAGPAEDMKHVTLAHHIFSEHRIENDTGIRHVMLEQMNRLPAREDRVGSELREQRLKDVQHRQHEAPLTDIERQ